jgi:hypothetical protein
VRIKSSFNRRQSNLYEYGKPKEGKSISSKPITDEGSSIEVKGGVGSSSKPELDAELAKAHRNVIIKLREDLSRLKANNDLVIETWADFHSFDFNTLISEEKLKVYDKDITKHLL